MKEKEKNKNNPYATNLYQKLALFGIPSLGLLGYLGFRRYNKLKQLQDDLNIPLWNEIVDNTLRRDTGKDLFEKMASLENMSTNRAIRSGLTFNKYHEVLDDISKSTKKFADVFEEAKKVPKGLLEKAVYTSAKPVEIPSLGKVRLSELSRYLHYLDDHDINPSEFKEISIRQLLYDIEKHLEDPTYIRSLPLSKRRTFSDALSYYSNMYRYKANLDQIRSITSGDIYKKPLSEAIKSDEYKTWVDSSRRAGDRFRTTILHPMLPYYSPINFSSI